MKYNVTFYKDNFSLLTQRKANFVNKLKQITSNLVTKLANECGGQGTSAKRIYSFCVNMAEKTIPQEKIVLYTKEIANEKVEHLPNMGKQIPIYFIFNNKNISSSEDNFDVSGKINIKYGKKSKRRMVQNIQVKILFTIGNDTESKSSTRTSVELLQKIKNTLVHQIAHFFDQFEKQEIQTNRETSSQQDIKYLKYITKPTEIRSHFNQVINTLNYRNSLYDIKRSAKNSYKNAIRAQQYGLQFTPQRKESEREYYKVKKKIDSTRTIDYKSKSVLSSIIGDYISTHRQKNIRKFIVDYHIAFARDYNKTMKQRYYDKLFPNTEVTSLSRLQDFRISILQIYKKLQKLWRQINRQYQWYSQVTQSQKEDQQKFFNFSNNFFDRKQFSEAFKNYSWMQLDRISEQLFKNFEKEMGL